MRQVACVIAFGPLLAYYAIMTSKLQQDGSGGSGGYTRITSKPPAKGAERVRDA